MQNIVLYSVRMLVKISSFYFQQCNVAVDAILSGFILAVLIRDFHFVLFKKIQIDGIQSKRTLRNVSSYNSLPNSTPEKLCNITFLALYISLLNQRAFQSNSGSLTKLFSFRNWLLKHFILYSLRHLFLLLNFPAQLSKITLIK